MMTTVVLGSTLSLTMRIVAESPHIRARGIPIWVEGMQNDVPKPVSQIECAPIEIVHRQETDEFVS